MHFSPIIPVAMLFPTYDHPVTVLESEVRPVYFIVFAAFDPSFSATVVYPFVIRSAEKFLGTHVQILT